MAMASKTNVHGPASYMMNTGFILPGFPCMGAWLSYGLGRLTDNLPTFVVLPDPAACRTTRRATSPRASCRSRTRARSSTPRGNPPIPDLVAVAQDELRHARAPSATAWTCSAR